MVSNDIDKEFEEFLKNCHIEGVTTDELLIICQPLVKKQRCKQTKIILSIIVVLLIAYMLLTQCDCVAWFLSAIGRLLLLQVLPYWNWKTLYNTKCLIENPLTAAGRAPSNAALPITTRLDKYETDNGNCLLCKPMEYIPAIVNVSFPYIETTFLERGLPVIVTDSHQTLMLKEFLLKMQNAGGDFLNSEPCDIATNLMLRKLFNLQLAMQKIKTLNGQTQWFLQFRNCDFAAVKASRSIINKTYYHPLHLTPYYSSWILMAHNYLQYSQEIYMHGLIFIQQLSGTFQFELRAKNPCTLICPLLNILLNAGEALIFSTDLWIVSYSLDTVKPNETAIATIQEIEWSF